MSTTQPLDELGKRIRERGVRVDERLALLRLLAAPDGAQKLETRQRELLAQVSAAISDVERELA